MYCIRRWHNIGTVQPCSRTLQAALGDCPKESTNTGCWCSLTNQLTKLCEVISTLKCHFGCLFSIFVNWPLFPSHVEGEECILFVLTGATAHNIDCFSNEELTCHPASKTTHVSQVVHASKAPASTHTYHRQQVETNCFAFGFFVIQYTLTKSEARLTASKPVHSTTSWSVHTCSKGREVRSWHNVCLN